MIFKDIDTPNLLVDIDILIKNIKEMQSLVNGRNVVIRPHTKTHKCPEIAKMQINEGAAGITVAKLGEAEVMVDSGVKDILIAYPIYGNLKKNRLINLLRKANIVISLDSLEVASYLSEIGNETGKKVQILFEVNTGINRCGVEPTDESIKLLRKINLLPGIKLIGLMGYSGSAYSLDGMEAIKQSAYKQYQILIGFKEKMISAGLTCEVVSTGSTPTVIFEKDFKGITELRPGGYIFNDRTQVSIGRIGFERCAASVLSTVVSVPVPTRAIIDAGTKAFSSDMLFGDITKGFGYIKKRSDLYLEKMNEEHGFIKSLEGEVKLKIGDRLEIIPNHICATVNNFHTLFLVQDNKLIKELEISGQGKLQ